MGEDPVFEPLVGHVAAVVVRMGIDCASLENRSVLISTDVLSYFDLGNDPSKSMATN